MVRSRKTIIKRGAQHSQKAPEASRTRISQLLEQFRDSDDQAYTFEENLTSVERAVVHLLCRKMGMTSKSSGRGNQRHVSVSKSNKKSNSKIKEEEFLPNLTFSEDAKEVLRELFTNYPPDDEEVVQEVVGKRGGKVDKIRARQDDIFRKPSVNKAQIARKLESLSAQIENSPNLRQITEKRSNLPIASFRDVITSTIESHQVVLISGETGCGKTTQLPQYLLDYMWSKGEPCKLVCTQPRRISAISVAERISSERGQIVGDDVGYKIRLECKGGRHSSIVFCTNGILLRILVSRGTSRVKTEVSNKSATDSVSDITHIVVDEIHERDRYSDFSLAILRDMLPCYPHLRLVLMSATLDAERFSQYFGGCPIIRVPGFTYPVKTLYLEDVLSILKLTKDSHLDCTSLNVPTEGPELTEEYRGALDEAISLAWSTDECDSLLDLISSEGTPKVFNYQHSSTGLTPLMVLAGKGRVGDVCMLLSLGADCYIKANDGTTAFQLAEREKQGDAAEMIKRHTENALLNTVDEKQLLDKYEASINPLFIDVVLIEQLLRKLCIDLQDGGILVFLPGWDDINRTRERLLANPFFEDSSKFIIIPLHSMVPSMEQKKVFRRPASGCRKIVLSTNIAETAVTIDDIIYVIDSGRMKEKSYDPYSNVSTLHSAWISKASAKQREGRAGRCQPGTCYHLYSKLQASSLSDFQEPEIKRMPIEELCLQVKLIDPNYKIEEFLRKTLDPPVFETIRNAIIVLQDIGALASDEKLTELGEKMGSLPVHPLTSKMLFSAILLNCLEPALTLACASGYRDPFTLPMLPNDKKLAAAAKSELASIYGGHSDELAVIAAFECWKNAKERGQEARFCSQYFISPSVMMMLSGMRKQLQTELIRNEFIPKDVSRCSLNARDPGILHAILVAGLYPKIGRLLPPLKSGKCCVIETAGGDKVRVHPQSTNFNLSFQKSDGYPLVIFDEITRGDRGMNIRSSSIVGPLPLSLLAKEIVVASTEDSEVVDDNEDVLEDEIDEEGKEKHNKSGEQLEDKIMSSPDKPVKVVIDRWLSFKSTAIDIAQIYCLRERLSAAILFKVTYPHKALLAPLEASVYAIACILSFDGISGISVPSDNVNSLALKKDATEIGKSAPGTAVGRIQNSFLESLMGKGPCHKTQCITRPHLSKGTVTNLNGPVSEASITLKPSWEPVTSNYMRPPITPFFMNPNHLKEAVNRNLPISVAPFMIYPYRAPFLGHDLGPPNRNPRSRKPKSSLPVYATSANGPHGPSPATVSSNNLGPPITPVCMNPKQLKGAVNRNSPLSEPPITNNPSRAPRLSHDLEAPVTTVCLKPNRKPRAKKPKPSLPVYGSSTYGPYGPRGASFKRQRGNGTR